ncbi:hypothetical protein H632_c2988p0, partial [Helicosporidium sp. ATCC 50920]
PVSQGPQRVSYTPNKVVIEARKASLLPAKKRRANDTRLTESLAAAAATSPLLAELVDAERRVDVLLSRKRAEIQEMVASFRRGAPGTAQAAGGVPRTLRLFVFSQHFNQPARVAGDAGAEAEKGEGLVEEKEEKETEEEKEIGQGVDEEDETMEADRPEAESVAAPSSSGNPPLAAPSASCSAEATPADSSSPPSWALRIQGRIVGEGSPAPEAALPRQSLTSLVRRLTVELDPAQYPGSEGSVTWDKARQDAEPRDAFEIRRAGSRDVPVTLTIELDHAPPLYRPSPELAKLLGVQGLVSVPNALQLLWGYVKGRRLFDPSPQAPHIRCDAALAQVLGAPQMRLGGVQDALKAHLATPAPLVVRTLIRTSGPSPSRPECFDLEVYVPLSAELPLYLEALPRGLEGANAQLQRLLAEAAERRRRHALLLAFAQSPVATSHAIIAAQGRELRTVAGNEGEALHVLRPGQAFADPWVEDAVFRYLQQRQAGRRVFQTA